MEQCEERSHKEATSHVQGCGGWRTCVGEVGVCVRMSVCVSGGEAICVRVCVSVCVYCVCVCLPACLPA